MDYDLNYDHHHLHHTAGDEMITNVILAGLQRDPTGPYPAPSEMSGDTWRHDQLVTLLDSLDK